MSHAPTHHIPPRSPPPSGPHTPAPILSSRTNVRDLNTPRPAPNPPSPLSSHSPICHSDRSGGIRSHGSAFAPRRPSSSLLSSRPKWRDLNTYRRAPKPPSTPIPPDSSPQPPSTHPAHPPPASHAARGHPPAHTSATAVLEGTEHVTYDPRRPQRVEAAYDALYAKRLRQVWPTGRGAPRQQDRRYDRICIRRPCQTRGLYGISAQA